jgi:hypothetical protein
VVATVAMAAVVTSLWVNMVAMETAPMEEVPVALSVELVLMAIGVVALVVMMVRTRRGYPD